MQSLLGPLLFLVYVIGGAAGIAAGVLRPIRQAAAKRRFPIQLRIADFLCLFFLMQAVMTVTHCWLRPVARWSQWIWILDGLGWVGAGLLWWGGVRTVSRAGIYRVWHRAALIGLVFPLTCAMAVCLPMLPLMVFFTYSEDVVSAAILCGIIAILIAALWGFARYTRWTTSLVKDTCQVRQKGDV